MKERKNRFSQALKMIADWDNATKIIWAVDVFLIGFLLYIFFPVLRDLLLLALAACTLLYLEFGDAIRMRMAGYKPGTAVLCRSCIGCNNAYPLVRTTVFEAVRRCSEHLHIQRPVTEQEMEACCPDCKGYKDNLPRCYFRLMKRDLDYPVSDFAAAQMLQKHLSDCTRSHPGRFSETGITDLYLEDLTQAEDSFLITVMPYCLCATDNYIQKCIQQQTIGDPSQNEEEVFDDEL